MKIHTSFYPRFDDLPRSLPIFSLENALVLPGVDLPLNIFEPRYLNMVADVLKTHRMFGLIQPDTASGVQGALYATGCAGRITSFAETEDGRVLLVLTGVIRFAVLEELAGIRGYRTIVPSWDAYRTDLNQHLEGEIRDRLRLTSALSRYLRERNMTTDWEKLIALPGPHLVNTMTTLLPLGSAEKQAILEAHGPERREALFIAALETAFQDGAGATRH
ncbi:MAG: LON peptidase substrate-binding domain-containing protein [Gammaproteobacteria bacterium]|nr:LON peptidase substrate-binding domain-containing protein [Gammaproteobacteria bacterium]